ncbi:putative fluconazole resistance protein 1 [[Candida] jaroonii]|uniref:Fluconazole resistance protein 1 n=1 Tax=[Candida] jaroonii TaxID=467808 RepID=A0ACA9YEJ8_9ASCO|nr:putative fluconazole resistance protein 1 [[Candida] jaroonii]
MYNIPSSPDDHHPKIQKKKRVGKACDSCRIKKTKCDGKKPCNKCIQDNKICVFTEKKKIKEKSYPSGYVELLETRLDLLTKSFEKMIQLSRPHLSFLNQLVVSTDEDNEEEDLVPINKVINYLINNEGLLKNLPIEWENGAVIAANFNENDIEQASKKFANHRLNLEDPVRQENDEDEYFMDENLDDLNLGQFQLGNYSTGGFVLANSAALNDGISNDLSDFESDSNSIYSANLHSPGLSPGLSSQNLNTMNNSSSNPGLPGSNNFDIKPPSLFESRDLFQNHNSSVNSLQEKTYSPATISPSSTFDSQVSNHHNHNSHSHSQSSHKRIQRPRSPSFQKLKNSGHVHKPIKNEFDIKNSLLDNELIPSDSISDSIKYDLKFEDSILKDL